MANKMEAQCRAFVRLGCTVDLVSLRGNEVLLNQEKCLWDFSKKNTWANIYLLFYPKILRLLKGEKYDLLYIRYQRGGFLLPWALRGFKRANPSLRIVLEMPSYPFGAEIQSIKDHILNLLDRLGNQRLRPYIDLIATFSEHRSIFGIPTVRLTNGVDLEKVSFVPPPELRTAQEMHLLGVANLSRAHAFDRVIKGLAAYAQSKAGKAFSVYFHLVGDGKELVHLRQLAQALGVQDSVIFHGHKVGSALESCYQKADLAVGTLGAHRFGIFLAAPLKVREYCAKGLPFVIAYRDISIPEDFPYAFSAPPDESDIDIAQLVDFYLGLQLARPGFRNEIRAFAENTFSWDAQLKLVFQSLGVSPAPSFQP